MIIKITYDIIYSRLYLDGDKTKYAVSSDGKVINLKTGYIMKPFINHKGYHVVHLSHNKKSYTIPIHRLVALEFIPNPDNKPQVNHIDGVKSNNSVQNLEWCTCKENIHHAEEHNLRHYNHGSKHHMSKYTDEQIHLVCKLLEENNITQRDIWLKTGVSTNMIRKIRTHSNWTHISKLYNIDNFNKNGLYPDDFKNKISLLILSGKTNNEIRNIMNLPNNKTTKSFLYYMRTKNRRRFNDYPEREYTQVSGNGEHPYLVIG